MSEAQQPAPADNPRHVELRLAAVLENLAVVRTVIGALATFEDLDLDAVSDLRLAVDEACTRLIRSASPGATLVLTVDPGVNELVIRASTTSTDDDVLSPGSFSWHVLTSLTDAVETFSGMHDGADVEIPVVGIALTARRVSPAR